MTDIEQLQAIAREVGVDTMIPPGPGDDGLQSSPEIVLLDGKWVYRDSGVKHVSPPVVTDVYGGRFAIVKIAGASGWNGRAMPTIYHPTEYQLVEFLEDGRVDSMHAKVTPGHSWRRCLFAMRSLAAAMAKEGRR